MPLYSLACRTPRIDPQSWIAPNATVIGDVHLAKDASLWWNVTVRADNDTIRIGERSNIQDGCVLHADAGIPLTVGREVTVGHLAMLHGCTIGDGSLIGIGAVLLNRSIIGRQSIVGANSLIPEGKSYPDRSLIIGSPGKVVRQLSEDEVARLAGAAAGYVENWQRYRGELLPL